MSTCPKCKKVFKPARWWQVFCSPACRLKAWRKKQRDAKRRAAEVKQYLHREKCDLPGCKEKIDRGLAFACGGMHGASEGGCEGYFCGKHLHSVEDPNEELRQAVLCESCRNDHNARLVEDLIAEQNELREEQAMTTPLTDAQFDRIRQTVQPTVDDWRTDYGIPQGKEHGQLVNRIVAAIAAMHQSGVLDVKPIGITGD